jgi:hypothetical protein
MKNEEQAWRQLRQKAAGQLQSDFAERVMRQVHGADDLAWARLREHAAAQIRPGFAERVLRAARVLTNAPSLWDQLALCAATATVCLLGVLFVHERNNRSTEQANLVTWAQLADEMQNLDGPQ